MKKRQLKKIAVTGGPAGGKSTAMATLVHKLTKLGIRVFIVPEAATELILSGITPKTVGMRDFQIRVTRLQIHNEEKWLAEARNIHKRTNKECVLLCDREIIDAAGYLPGKSPLVSLNEILAELGTNIEEARARYDGVIHMVTAADGAEAFYTCSNNEARTETPEEARRVDIRTREAWLGHKHLRIVGNTDSKGNPITFEAKKRQVLREVLNILGYPEPLETEDKYIVESFSPIKVPVTCEMIEITQTYLNPLKKGVEERVRRRKWLGHFSYSHTIKTPSASPAQGRIEIERLINEKEYRKLLTRANKSQNPISKERYHFVWEGQYFEVDVFQGKLSGLIILEREKTNRNDKTLIPPFIKILKNVTNDPAYRNSTLALRAI